MNRASLKLITSSWSTQQKQLSLGTPIWTQLRRLKLSPWWKSLRQKKCPIKRPFCTSKAMGFGPKLANPTSKRWVCRVEAPNLKLTTTKLWLKSSQVRSRHCRCSQETISGGNHHRARSYWTKDRKTPTTRLKFRMLWQNFRKVSLKTSILISCLESSVIQQ